MTQTTETYSSNKEPFSSDFGTIPISDYKYLYLCPECHKFPLIEFCKDIKYIKYTCSCDDNKKKMIKDFIDETNKNSLLSNSFVSYDNNYEKKMIKQI